MVLSIITLIIVYIVCTMIEDKVLGGAWTSVTNLSSMISWYIFMYAVHVAFWITISRIIICILSISIIVYKKIKRM